MAFDIGFLVEGLKATLPITLLFVFLFTVIPPMGDYQFHLCNSPKHNLLCGSGPWGNGATVNSASDDYPNGVAWMMDFASPLLGGNRMMALFVIQLAAVVVLPYLLILIIMGRLKPEWRFKAGFVYLYGSGVPFILFQEWFVPQAIIQVLMLASVAEPQTLVLFLMVGWKIHREWLAAFLLTIGFLLFERYKHRLPVRWN